MVFRYIITQIVYWALFCAMFAFANPYLSSKGFSPSTIGTVVALSSLFAMFVQIWLSKLENIYEKLTVIRILIGSIVTLAVFSLIIAFTNNMAVLLVSFIIILLCLSNAQTFFATLVFEYINVGYNINFGLVRGVGSASFAFASLAYGVLGDKYGYGFIPLLSVVLSIAVTLMMLTYDKLPPKKFEPTDTGSANFIEYARKYKKFVWYLAGISFILATHGAIASFMKNIVDGLQGSDNGTLGTGLMIAAMVELPVMYFGPYFIKKFGFRKLIRFSTIFFVIKVIVTLIAYESASIPLFYLAQFTQFGAYAVLTPASVYYSNEIMSDKDKVIGQTYTAGAYTIGVVVGSLAGGFIIERTSVQAMLIACIVAGVLGVLTMWFNIERGVEKTA